MSHTTLFRHIDLKPAKFKLGLLLALAAWLMQLSVFLTPILSSHISIGYGVCEQLAALAQDDTHAAAGTRSTPQHDDMAGMSMAGMDMSGMSNMSAMAMQDSRSIVAAKTTVNDLTVTPPTHVPKATSPLFPVPDHGDCAFCLLFGHAILPPELVVIPLIAQLISLVPSIYVATKTTSFFPTNKNLRPQGRAPPLTIFF